MKTHPFFTHTLSLLFIFTALLSVLTGACNAQTTNQDAWKIIPSANGSQAFNQLSGVAAITSNNVWAVGISFGGNIHQSLIEHWNGKNWQTVPTPDHGLFPTLEAVAAIPGTNQVWAVGTQITKAHGNQTLIERWNGQVWQIVPSPLNQNDVNSNILYSVVATSKNDAWATGVYKKNTSQPYDWAALIEHWNGKQWSIVPGALIHNAPFGSSLQSITALSTNNVWATGTFIGPTGYKALVEHWNGHTWQQVQAPNPGTFINILNSITTIPGTNQLLAVGETGNTNKAGQILTERWNGKSWQVISTPKKATPGPVFTSITALSAHDAWAVGGEFIAHWDGANWNTVSHLVPSKEFSLSDITRVPGTDTLWAVGGNGLPPPYHSTTLIERYS
jgi:hypothetical protein